jgi:hypothetical protein
MNNINFENFKKIFDTEQKCINLLEVSQKEYLLFQEIINESKKIIKIK